MEKEKEELQIQIYKLISKAVTNNYAVLTDAIIRDKRWLERMDIVQDVYIYFHEKDYISKFDFDKGALSSFVYRFTFWRLNTINRKGYNKEVLFGDLVKADKQGDLKEFEVVDNNTPESLLLEKTEDKKNLKEFILNRRIYNE